MTVKDQNNQEIKLELPLKKIAVFVRALASTVIAYDESTDRIQGMHIDAKTVAKQGVLKELYPYMTKIPTDVVKNYVPNLEEVLRINPDVILQWKYLTMFDESTKKMQALGLKVVSFQTPDVMQNKTTETITEQLKMFGIIMDNKKKGEQLVDWRIKVLTNLKKKSDRIPDSKRLRCMSFIFYGEEYRTWKNFPMAFFNVKHIYDENFPGTRAMNFEDIIKKDPEIIFFDSYKKDASPHDLYNNKIFSEVNAIKNKRVYKWPVGAYRWNTAHQEDPLSLMWIAMILYPEDFNFDMRKEIKHWFKIMYNKTLSQKQIDMILAVKFNKDSKGYKRFMR